MSPERWDLELSKMVWYVAMVCWNAECYSFKMRYSTILRSVWLRSTSSLCQKVKIRKKTKINNFWKTHVSRLVWYLLKYWTHTNDLYQFKISQLKNGVQCVKIDWELEIKQARYDTKREIWVFQKFKNDTSGHKNTALV